MAVVRIRALKTSVRLAAAVGVASLAVFAAAQAQIAVQNQGYVPYSDAPINYRTQTPVDPVALAQKLLDSGEVKLIWDPEHGYIQSVLDLLEVPIDSQTLVFSKTSFQYPHISPQHPRALYFNDDTYVGKVHRGDALEVISFDPQQGAMFYVLDDRKADKPVFQRAELDCTTCHIASGTRGVPGVFLRSVYPTQAGLLAPRASAYITDQKSPLKERWGGWYVTGAPDGATMANTAVPDAPVATQIDYSKPAALPLLRPLAKRFDPSAYLADTSDQVALLVLGHQTQMHNLITLTNYQTRLALYDLERAGTPVAKPASDAGALAVIEALPEKQRKQITQPAEQLLRYLLFSNETSLADLRAGNLAKTSTFAREFASKGERDAAKRSLRDFDLGARLFRYPCSYLIYNPAFDGLPQPARGYVYHRLLQVLSGEDQSPDFAHLSDADRKAILSILIETKPNLPEGWRTYAREHPQRLASSSNIRP